EELIVRCSVKPLGIERLVQGRSEIERFSIQEQPLEWLIPEFATTDRPQTEISPDRIDRLAAAIVELESNFVEVRRLRRPQHRLIHTGFDLDSPVRRVASRAANPRCRWLNPDR